MDPLLFGFIVCGFALVGLGAGTVTGLVPGLHVNNVALLVLASRPLFEGAVRSLVPGAAPSEVSLLLCSFVMGTAIGHSFLDFVPSVYLGAPEERTALSVLPGHRMLLAGEGHVAVRLAAIGALAGVAVSVGLLVPLRLVLGSPVDGFERSKPVVALALVALVALLILSERERPGREGSSTAGNASRPRQWGLALLLFLVSGAFGVVLLDTPWLGGWNWFPVGPWSNDVGTRVLFPLFTGLFGFSTLALSSATRNVLPPQDLARAPGLSRRGTVHGVLSGSIAGALVSWLPGLSSGAATALAQFLSRGRSDEFRPEAHRHFMVALGAVSTSTSLFTVAVLFIIDRARSGAAVAIRDLNAGLVPAWDPVTEPPALLLALIASAVLSGLAAYPVTLACSRLVARRVHRVRYDLLARAVLGFLVVLLVVLAGVAGLMIAIVAGVIGLGPPILGVKRVHLMGCLIVPVILFHARLT